MDALTTREFRGRADALFEFSGSEQLARTPPGWLARERVSPLMTLCRELAEAYAAAPAHDPSGHATDHPAV